MPTTVTGEDSARHDQAIGALKREFAHRVNNLFVVIQSVVRQTLRGDQPPEVLLERLQVLAGVYDLLFRNDWQPVALGALVDRALLQAGLADRLTVSAGADVRLSSAVAVSMALALGELAAGTLAAGGTAELRWSTTGTADGRRIEIRWTENGGSGPDMRRQHGFGPRLLQGLGTELNATLEQNYAAEGLVVRLDLPVGPNAWVGARPAAG
jgi:two-component sensor histidine kinase